MMLTNYRRPNPRGRSSTRSSPMFFFPSMIKWLIGGFLCFFSIRPLWWQANIVLPRDGGLPIVDHRNLNLNKRAKSAFRRVPRIVLYNHETNKVVDQINVRLEGNTSRDTTTYYKIQNQNSEDSYESDKTCQVMHEWQTRIYPVCNRLHEINGRPETGSVVFINCGGDRCAFKVTESNSETVVLKIPKYKKSFEPDKYNAARKDGMAMERLQASPYVLDIYGYCGLSQVIELGDSGGNIHDLIKTTRLKGSDSLSSVDKLRIAYQLVSGVADMHTFETDGLVSLVHNDICCHQFILSHGVYKLNDFHLSQFQQKNRHTNEVCTARNHYSSYYKLIRSPEEIAYKLGLTKAGRIVLEKSDVYTIGNVMYYVLTMHWLFEGYDTKDAEMKVATGDRSPFPQKILDSDDRALRAVRKAIEWCWVHDPEKRPAASKVRKFLEHELKAVLGVKDDLGIVQVTSIDPLPKGYRYSDSDFNTMFGD